MKKVFYLVGLVSLLMASKLHAAPQFELYRSTDVNGAFQNFLVATSTIRLIDIRVSSGATGSTFVFNNSTSTNMIRSTSTVFDGGSSNIPPYEINQALSKGFMFTTTGSARWLIRWDYLYQIPVGKEGLGYR